MRGQVVSGSCSNPPQEAEMGGWELQTSVGYLKLKTEKARCICSIPVVPAFRRQRQEGQKPGQ